MNRRRVSVADRMHIIAGLRAARLARAHSHPYLPSGFGALPTGTVQQASQTEAVILFALPGGAAPFVMNMTQFAENAIDAVAELVATVKEIIDDPCLVVDWAVGKAQGYLEAYVTNAVADMLEAVSDLDLGGGGVDLTTFADCKARIQGGEKSCGAAAGAATKLTISVANAIGNQDFAGLLKDIIQSIIKIGITRLVKFVVEKLITAIGGLKDKLVGAIKRVLEQVVGRTCGGGSGQVPQQPINDGGTPGTGASTEPVIGGHAFLDAFSSNQPGAGGNYVPPVVSQSQLKVPPPLLVPTKRPVSWGDYLVWGGTGLAVALVASKTLTGAWVPPVIRRKAAPLVAKVRRLRR